MKSAALISVILFIANATAIEQNYPQESLQCYSTSALQSQKDGEIICPIGSTVCVKEVANASSRGDCGTVKDSKYYGRDVWDRKLAQCIYRKCASRCPTLEEDLARTFGGDNEDESLSLQLGRLPTPVFNRTSYCCDTNLCNKADKMSVGMIFISLAFIFPALFQHR